MAESAASGLLSVISEKLTDEAFKKFARSQKIDSELNELQSTLSQIRALLNDASQKEITDESVRLWMSSLQHLSYDIDDVLDDVATEAMHHELTQESGASTSMVRKLIPTFCKKFRASHRLSPKLDIINKQLQHLEKQKSDLGLIVKDEKPKSTSRRDETSLLESDVVGRKGETEKLINKLLRDEPSKDKFIVVPIVGMGGVGKTTLARILYNDTRVNDHFELRAWVCVSDVFDRFKISETIYQSVATEHKEFKDINQLQAALGEQLKDKRFLLVLDDVWTENYDDWEKLVRPFHLAAQGSRVIITTRKQQLLKKLGFNQLDHLESLSHEDALSLFAMHALGVDNFDSQAKLKPQGEGIVKKCGGLPLALKAIGRLLRTKTEGEEWDDVLNSEIWHLENVDEIVPALKLSFHYLSADLKRLFAYCSLFPKDFLFDKEELVLLWVAEGYLNESLANKSPERLGHEYFEKLLSRSFFQPAPSGESFFVMHDLMNELATFVAGEYFLRFDNQMEMTEEALAKYRHMSFIREEYVGFQKLRAFGRARSFRTLLTVYVGVDQGWKGFYLSSKILVDLLPELPLLRVLCLRRFKISEVPDFIGTLKHLRYLNLSQTDIEELPDNVGNLYNLQTLIVFGCRSLTKLPKSFLKLKRLRHFDIRDTPLLEMPLGIGGLKSLQTLTRIIIGGNKGFKISELKNLKDLHGEISIKRLNKVQSSTHEREVYLSLKGISKLELKWDDGSGRETLEMDVFNELKPCSDKLKTLVVKCYEGKKFPTWVGDPSFKGLVHVSLHGCRECTSLPPLGWLPSLKKLSIQGMDEIKVIGLELGRTTGVTFPSLEILRFEDMASWEVWSTNSDEMFPCLRELQIVNCPNLIDLSLKSLPSLRVLAIAKCGESVLRNLVRAALLTPKLYISSISGLTDVAWRGIAENFGAVEELTIEYCDEIRYMWESDVEASKVLVKLKELRISDCKNLVSLGEKEEDEDNIGSNLLSSLRILNVYSCKSMERLCCPNSIESLNIMQQCSSIRHVSFPRVTTTGEGGQNLKSLTISGYDIHMEKINNTSMPMLQVIKIEGWRNLKSINQLSNSTHLTSLTIRNCESMESVSDLQLSNLTRLYIEGCESIESFPNLQLPNLTHLHIFDCKNMKEFGDLQLPNLTQLYIFSCKNMKEFGELHIPNLISWRIEDCENLESFPDLQLSNLTMLKDVHIRKCPMIDASFPRGIWPPNLSSLEIEGLKKPISEWGYQNFPASLVKLALFGELHIPNLIRWSLYNCENLESFPDLQLSKLTMLKQVCMGKCPMIDAHGIWPPNLSDLEVGGLKKPISEWGYQNFPASLVHLKLWGEPDVMNFSQLSHLLPSSLTSLEIYIFDNLESLLIGLQHLTSLHLYIYKCPKLINLPETLLPSLLSLRIVGCPRLKERCDGRGSNYRPRISHIPCINIY